MVLEIERRKIHISYFDGLANESRNFSLPELKIFMLRSDVILMWYMVMHVLQSSYGGQMPVGQMCLFCFFPLPRFHLHLELN